MEASKRKRDGKRKKGDSSAVSVSQQSGPERAEQQDATKTQLQQGSTEIKSEQSSTPRCDPNDLCSLCRNFHSSTCTPSSSASRVL
mmetsp:Transcript_51351/g.100824  ORF Transcript_51351/g.100824 Transcript_51351/m.100824 type:complete len:86 (+) Transcript_51351:165-422(+)